MQRLYVIKTQAGGLWLSKESLIRSKPFTRDINFAEWFSSYHEAAAIVKKLLPRFTFLSICELESERQGQPWPWQQPSSKQWFSRYVDMIADRSLI
jgi:hypothetical protein